MIDENLVSRNSNGSHATCLVHITIVELLNWRRGRRQNAHAGINM